MKILIVSPVSSRSVTKLSEDHDVICAFNAPQAEIMQKIADRDVLVFRSGPDINADVMRCAPNLSLLVRAGSGLDNLDLDYVKKQGIALHRIEGPGSRAVAELSFTLMLGLARQISVADSLLRQGKWAKHEITGYLLSGKTLGIYGCGNIGSVVGRLGVAWGMNVIACIESPCEERKLSFRQDRIRLTDAEEVLTQSDFLSIHVPLQPSTRNLIDEQALAQMKSTAFLVNLARGGVVKEDALLDALLNGQIAGAGVDVHEREGDGHISPLAGLSNVILTPHIGAGTVDTKNEIGEQIVEIVSSYTDNMIFDEQPATVNAALP